MVFTWPLLLGKITGAWFVFRVIVPAAGCKEVGSDVSLRGHPSDLSPGKDNMEPGSQRHVLSYLDRDSGQILTKGIRVVPRISNVDTNCVVSEENFRPSLCFQLIHFNVEGNREQSPSGTRCCSVLLTII